MNPTYFRTSVQGSTLTEIAKKAEEAIQLFFGRDVPFVLDISPHLMGDTVDGTSRVITYEAEVKCRGFEI